MPAIIMSHGFSATRHMGLPSFAERFQAAGFAVLLFDYRCLGDSDGDERGRIVPQEQHDDLRAAIGFLARQPGIDAARIGLWGTSYSGGHALFVGALDPRIKAIVAQVPALSVARSLIGFVGAEGFAGFLAAFAGWVNHTTFESIARMAEYLPAAFIDLAAKPILIQAAEHDGIIPISQVHEAFARAQEPKALEIYPCDHFGLYPGRPFHEAAAERAAGWFGQYL
jgi:cephalosporin-C deacetylase-like acetyl esterase